MFHSSNSVYKTKTNRQKIFVYDSQNRPQPELARSVLKVIESGRKIGRTNLRVSDVPENVVKAINHIVLHSKYKIYDHLEGYLEAGVKLRNVLWSRHQPLNEKYGKLVASRVEESVRKEYEEKILKSQDGDTPLYDKIELENEIQKKISNKIAKIASFWRPIHYDDESAIWAYLLGKSASDYASLERVMLEIQRRAPKFQPRTLLDFGTGVGTSIWAVQKIFGQMTEIFAVDASPKMIDFARLILVGGKEQAKLPTGIFFRIHLPKSTEVTYDIVTCAYTLLDLSSQSERLTVLENLWEKTQHFLVLIEVGTNAGFQVMSEARHHLIEVCKAAEIEPITDELYQNKDSIKIDRRGHLFAPCPQELPCPRFHLDNIPCNFGTRFREFYFDKMPKSKKGEVLDDKFCYLVFRKGGRAQTHDCQWPRVVEEPLLRHKHAVCRMCTKEGSLEEIVTTSSKDIYKKLMHKYVRHLHWGDQFKGELNKTKSQLDVEVSDDLYDGEEDLKVDVKSDLRNLPEKKE